MRSRNTRIFLLKNRSARAVALRGASRTHTPSLKSFRSTVWGYWKENGRHNLPWRKTTNPYRIMVSEVILQQTQVSRVSGKYRDFLEVFPTIRALAKAPLGVVLRVWSGLGYNRRGKYLHEAAKTIVTKHKGKIPGVYRELVELPGMGPYTASAVRLFAFNEPDVLIETNIRSTFIHHFFPTKREVTDKQLIPFVTQAAKGQNPRTWHWALMDYGAYLKRSGVRNNHRSTHYTKQSKFEGSLRQVRSAILRDLMN